VRKRRVLVRNAPVLDTDGVVDSTELLRSVSDLPDHEVRRLLAVATGRHWTELILGVSLTDDEVIAFRHLADERRAGEPLQYIEGESQFGPIHVAVDERVLIPRPETEQLFELACRAVSDPKVIVDLCTGSGNLALALKHTFPCATVYGTDLSADAIDVACSNAVDNDLEVTFLEGDLFEPLPSHLRGHIDLLVSNPPYVTEEEFAELPPDVRDHEPVMALVSGPEGDEVLRRIAGEAIGWLRPGGVIICEISEFHGETVAGHFAALGGRIRTDLSGRDRFVIGIAPQ